jgi:hypothetical protein
MFLTRSQSSARTVPRPARYRHSAPDAPSVLAQPRPIADGEARSTIFLEAAIRADHLRISRNSCLVGSSSSTNRLLRHLPAVRGGLLALIAAVLFGISTPLVQKFGAGVDAFATAALLYAGAAVVGALLRQRVEREARVVRGDFPRLLAMGAAGAVVGPVALAWGLQRTSGTSASLMLTMEALFTAVLAWRLYRETMDGRVWAAMLLLLAGGILLVLDQAHDGGARLWGLLAVLIATPVTHWKAPRYRGARQLRT